MPSQIRVICSDRARYRRALCSVSLVAWIAFVPAIPETLAQSSATPRPSATTQLRTPVTIESNAEIKGLEILSTTAISREKARLATDREWLALHAHLKSLGFSPVDNEAAAWSGRLILSETTGRDAAARITAVDYVKNDGKGVQTASLLWREMDDRAVRSAMVFPVGEKDGTRALAGAQVWNVSSTGNVIAAGTSSRCMQKCVEGGNHLVYLDMGANRPKMKVVANCKTSCMTSIALCAAATVLVGAATGGPVALPWAVAIFFGCAALGCAHCLAVCALAC